MALRLFRFCLILALVCGVRKVYADDAKADPSALSAEAEQARASGLYERCIEKDKAAIAVAPTTERRVHLAGCADKANQVLLALEQLKAVLDEAIKTNNAQVADLVGKRSQQLLKRLAAITLDPPPNADSIQGLEIDIDDTEMGTEYYKKPVTVNPGTHRVHAEGKIDGELVVFDEVEELDDGERVTVAVVLKAKDAPAPTPEPGFRPGEHLTAGQIECLHNAKSDEEAFRCLPSKAKPLVARAALEWSTYTDSFNVLILNPMARFNIASPTNGWSFGASYLIDVISAASPDFVSTASPTGHDLRQAVAINGSYKPGLYGADASAGYSTEADYISKYVGVGFLGDFFDKQFTPRIGWNIADDTILRGGTPATQFHHTLITNEGMLSLSMVMGPKTVLVLGGTAGFERGDQSKPYRLIPMFGPGIDLPPGASTDQVNAQRLPVRPYEQLPTERNRVAAGGRIVRRFGPTTLRAEERLYVDTWSNKATTTDIRWLIDIGSRFTVGPHFRYNQQTGTSFFQRIYRATLDPVVVPTYRTTDRELGPFFAFTGGASMWWRLTGEDTSPSWMLYASGDGLFDFYTNSLYVKDRQAVYGTVGIETVFE